MRAFHLGLIGLLVLGCGGDSTGPAPEGSIAVQFDVASCNPGTAEVYIDNVNQGAYFWVPGQSRSWTVDAGNHVVGAREVGGSQLVWPSQTTTVRANATSNILFTC